MLSLSDGHLELPPGFIFGDMPAAERAAVLKAHGIDPDQPLQAPCNVTLLRDGDRTVLFDVGAGPDFQSSAGRLRQALDAIGMAPGDVTDVIFTHAHPDHLWGLLDDFDDLLFANARHVIGGQEFDYWTAPATLETTDPTRQLFAAGASRRLGILADEALRADDGDSPVPGITARLTPGHTPGHMSWDLGDLLVTGDCIGNGHISFDRPGMELNSDQDASLAAETRQRLMAGLAASGQPILGFHLPQGGIGRVVKQDRGYRFAAT